MALTAGARLGPYEILAALGAGGMGEVYKARDTRLKRDVAIKVLPEAFAHDPDRLARFQREAELLATLNHPNIAAVYGIEKTDASPGSGQAALTGIVLELVEGPTLADRIAGAPGGPEGPPLRTEGQRTEGQRTEGQRTEGRRGGSSDPPIPIDEALSIVRQIADALEAAHEKGVIHRDLKPANIKVTADGKVKVLDFGLAKLTDSAGSGQPAAGGLPLSMSPTLSVQATYAGVILGTAAYMSPEQARGRVVDKRTDVWAFGCVLFEMLTGTRPFGGEDLAETIGAVIHKEPAWAALPAATPATVRTVLQRCLEKDPKRRMRDIGDVQLALNGAFEPPAQPVAAAQPTAVSRTRIVAAASAVLLVGVAGATLATWALTRPAPAKLQPMRFAIVPPSAQRLLAIGNGRDIAISPDSAHVVYFASTTTGQAQLMVRGIDQLDAAPLRGIAGYAPFFSPDGRWVGFFTGGELKKVLLSGGSPITICRVGGVPRGASWGPDDTIVFSTSDPGTGLLSVPAGGGEPRVLTKPDGAQGDHYFPSVLPGGRAVLFTIYPIGPIDNAQVAVLDLTTGQLKTLVRGGYSAQYVDVGYLVYAAGTLRAVRFDVARLEVLGDPVPVVEQVSTGATAGANFDVARDGTLVYVPGGAGAGQYGTPRSLVWVTRQGREEPINLPPRTYTYPRVSPDGTRVALDIRDQENDIWIGDLSRQALTRPTFDPATDFYPIWTPDGRRIIFQSVRAGNGHMFWQSADGTGTVEQLTTASTTPHYPYSVSPDEKSVVFQETFPKTGVDLSLLTFDPKPHTEPLIQTTFIETNAEISPDGHWLAYQSNESGQEEIYVRPFPKVDEGRWQISTGGGTRPLWARSGRELFYLDTGGLLMTVPVQNTPSFSAATPARVFNTRYFGGFGGGGQNVAGRTYDVSPDGQRFLMIKDVAGADQNATPASIVVVLNWAEELKRLVPAK